MKSFRIIIISILLLAVHSGAALAFERIGAMCQAGSEVTVQEDIVLEGVIISDWENPNMEVNPNASHTRVDLNVNAVTAYMQALDGSWGIRLRFDSRHYNRLCRYDLVKINLKGLVLSRAKRTGAVTVSGLTPTNVVAYSKGSAADVVVKEKYISELKDEDIYTWITLKDVEFIFKNGTYADIQESYGQRVEKYHSGYKSIHGRMDGWVSSLRDVQGSAIYMMVNSLCDWRRDGDGVPVGVGTVSGVVVSSNLRRFGDSIGRYSIRPFDKASINMPSKKSNWKPLTGFYLDGSMGQTLFFEKAGEVQNLNKKSLRNDRALNDVGAESYLWTDSGAEIRLVSDMNYLNADASANGQVKNGAIEFKTSLCSWYKFDDSGKVCGTNGIYLEFSTKKVKEGQIHLSFDIAAGNGNMDFCQHFPYEWKVEFSLDGQNWTTVGDNATGLDCFAVRTLPAWNKTIDNKKYLTQYDCGMGYQQHNFRLPDEAAGKEKVLVKISPASAVLAALHPTSDKSSKHTSNKSNVASPTNKAGTCIRFGTIRVDYK